MGCTAVLHMYVFIYIYIDIGYVYGKLVTDSKEPSANIIFPEMQICTYTYIMYISIYGS